MCAAIRPYPWQDIGLIGVVMDWFTELVTVAGKEMEVVLSAPFSFVVAVSVGLFIVWIFTKGHFETKYRGQIKGQQERIGV
jgi:hypothetical protein